MATTTSPQGLHPNVNIGRSLASFENTSPVALQQGQRSNPTSPRSSHPPSVHSRPSRSGANTPVDTSTPAFHNLPLYTNSADHLLLTPPIPNPDVPLVICFRGSGDTCRRSWLPLGRDLSQKYRVLLYERPSGLSVPEATTDLLLYLDQHDLRGPYVLIAHSHGGAHARCFIHRVGKADIAGVVLVETGQEAIWDAKIHEDQEDHHVLGERPLVVIKGNSFIKKSRKLEEDDRELHERAQNGEKIAEAEKASIMLMRNEINRWDKEDTKLKRQQLKLSKRHRFVNLPDVGHHVIRDAPERVAAEVDWIMANLKTKGSSATNSADGSRCNSRNASAASSRRPSVDDEAGQDGLGRTESTMKSWFRKASLALSSSKDRKDARRSSR